ncbi:MAG: hypothetical protein WA322_21500 [Pseudolabrys sp.]
MSIETSNKGKNPIIDDRGLAFVVYILYFIGYVTGITAIIGVISAHLQAHSASSEIKSHYIFQIRTWWFVCSLVRLIKGILALNRNEPIGNPEPWMFGDCGREVAVSNRMRKVDQLKGL